MPSRVSLSVLAFVCGLAIMFLGAVYGIIPIPNANPNLITTIIVLVGLLAVAVGWVRIFGRRPTAGDNSSR